MGELVRRVNLAPLTADGDMGEVRTWKALIDTGATVTVIPSHFLEGVDYIHGLPSRLGKTRYPTAILAVSLDGEHCEPQSLSVVISTVHAKKAEPEAQMILGHDYLQRERGFIAYTDPSKVGCLPMRKRRHRG